MAQAIESFAPLAFDAIRIGICSPEKILKESHGEVKKPETINYRTFKPEQDGLFCEKIFGPTKDWECHCGKYKKIRYKGVICDKCGVEVTRSSVRRSRIGHIALAAPVSHIWYLKGIPSRMGLLLDMSQRDLEKVIYFASYVVLDQGKTSLKYKQVLSERQYRDAREEFGYDAFRVGMGAESVHELLTRINLEEEVKSLREELKKLKESSGQKKIKVIKRLEVAEKLYKSGNRPEWMVLTVLPVIPPDIRPMVQLDGGRFAASDLNELYRRIINRNNRLQRLLDLGAPDIIVKNEKRMLQESVDTLIDNGRRGRAISGAGNRPLKSLSDMLKGKQGRFRQNLLGKRVDYSGRSVIVVGPELKIYQCGLPKEMAIELFKPFIMRELIKRELVHNVKSAKKMVERQEGEVWDILDEVIKEHPVMLNRAPTLHRLGIQAFEPILVEGKAIKLHPLVCTAFNADFDGDQMAVHVPLSSEAQAECRFLLLSTNNLLKPSDGGVVAVPSQDMVLGIYYLTQEDDDQKEIKRAYKSINEAILAYENKIITLHEKIKIKIPDYEVRNNIQLKNKKDLNGDYVHTEGIIVTTVGRVIFNEIIPQDLGFVDRTKTENKYILEIDKLVKKKDLKSILEKVMEIYGATKTAEVLDNIKSTGYKYSTKAAMSVSIADMTVPPEKKELIKQAEKTVEQIGKNYKRGLITEEERYKEVINTWQKVDQVLEEKLMAGLDKHNNIFMMADSGARGSNKQIKQLAGMRGLMADTTGHTIELPIKSNFREGLDVLEYFISAHGARKGLSDTALRTADSGYLTRRLVDISHDITIREDDCCANGEEIPYMEIKAFVDGEEIIEGLRERITGRFIAQDIINSETGEVIINKDNMVTPTLAKEIINELERSKQDSIKIRTVLTCKSKNGTCAKCYGMNLASGKKVGIGESVGVIAAQSIGEPGTQLTMRTFHTGGVAGGDITQGLPRVEELFEARKPKGRAVVTQIAGKVKINNDKKKREIVITDIETGDEKSYLIPYGSRIKVEDGGSVRAGDALTEGSIDPHDILEIKGVREVQDYLLREVQRVYRLQGVEINDKHIEMIVRQMLRKVKITEEGDSNLLPGMTIDIQELNEINQELNKEGKNPVRADQVLLGITKASLATDSFLSAASFQETTKVLTEASITGKIDHLQGLKENVIIGRLIQSGTGMKKYQDVEISTDNQDFDTNEEEDTFEYKASELDYQGLEFKEEIEDENIDNHQKENELLNEDVFGISDSEEEVDIDTDDNTI
ncbi:MAG: DNA-directed RNA polymerase subunit beta' [Eubacteriales bacterium]|nr:DNA-directed RNA polymerase subunit beta' [Eubacteriales bacterium]